MPTREDLIRRKNEVIGEQASLRRRLQAARSGPSHRRQQVTALQMELAHLQAEERRLRLAIDRTPPTPTLPKLHTKDQTMQSQFDALITAGYDRDKPDPLTEITGEPHKVLVQIAGAPMIWHVVRALDESGLIGEIVIVGLEPEHALDFGRAVHIVEDQGSLFANQRAGVETLAALNHQNRYIFATTGDTPLLTGEVIRWFIEACHPLQKDAYWGIVERSVMEMTFPLSRRSYLRLREGQFCSGDLFLVDLQAALRVQEHLAYMFASRKSVLRQLRFFGFSTIVRFLCRRLSLSWLLDLIKKRLDVTGMAVQIPFAEAGMDVDKPHQLEQVLEYLSNHADHPANTRTRRSHD